MDNAADEAGTELKNNSKKPNVGQNPERLDKHRDISVVEIKENSSMEVNSSETWSYGNPNKIGPGRRRFVVGYYPNLTTAITRHSIWTNNRRRSHWTVRPHNTAKGIPAKAQDLYWSGHSRITSDSDHMCLDESNTLGDLYWHSCHNGGNQHFWFAQFGVGKSKTPFIFTSGETMEDADVANVWIMMEGGSTPIDATMVIIRGSGIGMQQQRRVQPPLPQPQN